MQPTAVWDRDAVFIEIDAKDADLAKRLREAGYTKYLGVSRDSRRIAAIQADHPEFAEDFTCSQRPRIVRRNNAEVLILSGISPLHFWRYRSIRHAKSVAWAARFHPVCWFAWVACLLHVVCKRCSWPRIVRLPGADGKDLKMFVTNVLRRKCPGHGSLHFIPHRPGLSGLFQTFDSKGVRYVVLRWFESLPSIGPDEDVDILVADESLQQTFEILNALPGIQPCDVYSERGLARSDYRGTPYYPAAVADTVLRGAVRHNDTCMVPNPHDYFHSLAYHAVYHKGSKSNLRLTARDPLPVIRSGHDFTSILQKMADDLGIDVEITLEGLHAYLQKTGWGPSPEMLARLAVATRRSRWLKQLAARLDESVHDQGLAVFVLRQQAVQRGFTDEIIEMIRDGGFKILAAKQLCSDTIKAGAEQTRGGNWTREKQFDLSGGPPAAIIIAYDHEPQRLSKRQLRRFPERTNARLFIKEDIREAICSQMPQGERFNALHSSDHAAEAWHLIEVLAPELIESVRNQLAAESEGTSEQPQIRRAA